MIEETRDTENPSRIVTFMNICAARLFSPVCFAFVWVVLCVVVREWIPKSLLHWADPVCGVFAIGLVFWAVVSTAAAWSESIRREINMASPITIFLKIMIILAVVGLLFAYGYTILLKLKYPGMPQRGEFGDAFGALNAVVSTIALIGLWLTVWIQYRQMSDDRRRYVNDRRVEEQQKADERLEINKRSWPAVVVSDISGRVGLVGVNSNGKAAFRFNFHVVQKTAQIKF